jgi:3-hydroxyacyl-CoA dehydrogenase/enoyl-CoA hydratase/3-hydroxybutyryl-CoA epimerase
MEAGLEMEADAFADLAVGEVARNLIFLFFTAEFAKSSAKMQAAKSGIAEVQTVGIVGGGNMGASIAQLAAGSGHKVLLSELTSERAVAAVENIKRPDLDISPVSAPTEMAGADLILEAVFEDLDVKAKVFNELANVVSGDCVFATNTSSLSVEEIASKIDLPQAVVGLHFFHPVDKMPLIEVISQPRSAPSAVARALAFASKLDKVPVLVKDGPGFLVNRLLCSYLAEAGKLAQERVPMNWIDDAAVAFGMPMGPLALLDEVGLDIAFKVSAMLHERCGERLAPPAVFKTVEDLGLVGKKTGLGLYLWEDGRKQSFNPNLLERANLVVSEEKPDKQRIEELCDRLILPMIDEAARCMEEKIVRRARELDMAMILGIGFPAFRGGPLRYADSLGLQTVVQKLDGMETETGRKPCNLLIKMCQSGRRFYSAREAD